MSTAEAEAENYGQVDQFTLSKVMGLWLSSALQKETLNAICDFLVEIILSCKERTDRFQSALFI